MAMPPPTLLPTSTVGSHGLPGWVWLAREAMASGRLGALDPPERLWLNPDCAAHELAG
jgi:methionine synthase II (cobalamin-independent)